MQKIKKILGKSISENLSAIIWDKEQAWNAIEIKDTGEIYYLG